jgi:hypothetical protein
MRWAVILLLLTGTAMARPDPKALAQALMHGDEERALDPRAKASPTKGVFPQYWMFPDWAIPGDLRESERPQLDRPKRDPRPVG